VARWSSLWNVFQSETGVIEALSDLHKGLSIRAQHINITGDGRRSSCRSSVSSAFYLLKPQSAERSRFGGWSVTSIAVPTNSMTSTGKKFNHRVSDRHECIWSCRLQKEADNRSQSRPVPNGLLEPQMCKLTASLPGAAARTTSIGKMVGVGQDRAEESGTSLLTK